MVSHIRDGTKNKLINGAIIMKFMSFLIYRNHGQRILGAAGLCPGKDYLVCGRNDIFLLSTQELASPWFLRTKANRMFPLGSK